MSNEENEKFVEYIKGLVYEITRDNDELNPDTITCILQNKNDDKDVYVLMTDYNGDRVYFVNIFDDSKTDSTPEWALTFDEYLYDRLAEGYEIKWMDDNAHAPIWTDIIEGNSREDILENVGMQKYINYCKENNITQEKVSDEVWENVGNLMEYANNIKPRNNDRER